MRYRIVNRKRFTIFCMISVIVVGMLGYGMYRGSVWAISTLLSYIKEDHVTEDKPIQGSIAVMSFQKNSLVEELEWVSRFAIGCESDLLIKDGVVSLTLSIIPSTALYYYPMAELQTRMYQQSLKLLQDISKLNHLNELKRLDLLYVDSRFMTNENPVGEVISLRLDGEVIQMTNWETVSYSSLEIYQNK